MCPPTGRRHSTGAYRPGVAVLADLQEVLAKSVADTGLPGAAVAVLHDGEVYEAAAGVLNLKTGVETTTDSLFQIGSITKAMQTPQVSMPGEPDAHMGLGWMIRDIESPSGSGSGKHALRTVSHNGGTLGQAAFLEPDDEGKPQLFFAGRLARRAA